MDFASTELRDRVARDARLAPAVPIVDEANLRTALAIATLMATGLGTALLCRRPIDASSFGALEATASAVHSSWSHFYAPALPCPAGRLSRRAISSWIRYIADCYFPGMRQRLAKPREAKGSRLSERSSLERAAPARP
jgi:hypothetical protein